MVSPDSVIDQMTYEHPQYTHLRRRSSAASRVGLGRARVCRCVPRMGFPRGRCTVWPACRRTRRRSVAVTAPITPSIVHTSIRHVRTEPLHNEFEYRSYSWLVDVDDLPELPKALRSLAKFDAGDHLGDPTRSIRTNVESFLATNGLEFAGGRILMLANARVLGHVFNPLSVFWCLNDDGSQRCVVAEVHNTYGERHCYLLETDERGGARTSKEFYVSPFNDLDGEYRMRLPLPDTALALDSSGP